MANVFNLEGAFKEIVDNADQMETQTFGEIMEAAAEGKSASELAGDLIATYWAVSGELEVIKDYERNIQNRKSSMETTMDSIKGYIKSLVDVAGEPHPGDERFKTLKIKSCPWAKKAWTQYEKPMVEIIDERLIDIEYEIPAEPKIDTKAIAAAWKANQERANQERAEAALDISDLIQAGEIDEKEADRMLWDKEKELKEIYGIPGVEIKQSIGVQFE